MSDARSQRADLAMLGHGGPLSEAEQEVTLRALQGDDPGVRSAALGALVRGTAPADASGRIAHALADPDPAVRRRAAELAPRVGAAIDPTSLVGALGDSEALVAEAAAFALGEHPQVADDCVRALERTATEHEDALVREAAVAALGSLGRAASLPSVLAACGDRPTIRRRAVLALAAFDGPEVEAALTAALDDPDWQVRQAAEDLTGRPD